MSLNRNNKLELYRKIFHIFAISLWIVPVMLFPEPLTVMLFAVAIFFNFALTKRYNWKVLKPLYFLAKHLEREKNRNKPGIQGLWANVGIFLCFIIFGKEISVLAILILAVGDGLSGIVGYYTGKYKVYGDKTLEGTLTFLLSSFIITLLFYDIKTAIFVSVMATLTELFLDIPDDNFTVPISVGIALKLIH